MEQKYQINMDTTIVTALYDIGRDGWKQPFNRSYSDYFQYFNNILSLNCNLVVYIDEKDLNIVQNLRSYIDSDLNKTKIILKSFKESVIFVLYIFL